MVVILLDCVESYKVIQTKNGLEVYEGDDFVCEMRDSFFHDFEDEWGNIDEDELLAAVYEEIESVGSNKTNRAIGSKKALAIELVTKTIDALVDAITEEIVSLTDNGSKEITINLPLAKGCSSESMDYEYAAFLDDNGQVVFADADNGYEFPISDVEINMLIDVLNALTEGKYRLC